MEDKDGMNGSGKSAVDADPSAGAPISPASAPAEEGRPESPPPGEAGGSDEGPAEAPAPEAAPEAEPPGETGETVNAEPASAVPDDLEGRVSEGAPPETAAEEPESPREAAGEAAPQEQAAPEPELAPEEKPPEEAAPEPDPAPEEAASEPEPAPEEAPAAKPAQPPEDGKKKWYIVHTYSGYEQKVKLSIEKQIEKFRSSKQVQHRQIAGYFGDILIPTENVVELVKGQRKTSKRKFFPGYILVQMENNDESRHFVRETPKVSGFVGGGREPTPISDEELQRILRQQSEGAERPKPKVQFERGENIRVIHGPFSNFTGVVEDVKPEKGKVKVLVTIFGRATPVELSFVEVEKS